MLSQRRASVLHLLHESTCVSEIFFRHTLKKHNGRRKHSDRNGAIVARGRTSDDRIPGIPLYGTRKEEGDDVTVEETCHNFLSLEQNDRLSTKSHGSEVVRNPSRSKLHELGLLEHVRPQRLQEHAAFRVLRRARILRSDGACCEHLADGCVDKVDA